MIGKTRGPCRFCGVVDDVCTCRATRHVHPCPECYEHVPCDLPRQVLGAPLLRVDGWPGMQREILVDGCTIEPDLALDDGTESGSYVVCDRCQNPLMTFPPGALVTAFVDVVEAPARPLSRGARPDPITLGRVGDVLAAAYARASAWLLNVPCS